ncbi:unnamed protein product [Nippostrongylus brasiliensis]|uniref:I/LWEQ domain-containing protein n=1 Tax=Nippostrongylus brasiliensis TaxID=27835 RepID=A0A0N4YG03_NIPBR|nr:unnamed protein product [Nippostrongylus brasiliensis]
MSQSAYFCQKVKDAHRQNTVAETALEGATFKDDRQRISLANQNIRIVLKKSELTEVIPALSIALSSECNALFHVISSCTGSQNGTEACREGMGALCTALEDLVEAAAQLARGDQVEKIYDAQQELETSKLNGESCGWQSYYVGLNVSNALQSLQSNTV